MQELDDLAERFWRWRAERAPRGRDDIPRLDRPAGWPRPVGTDSVAEGLDADRRARDAFAAELAALRPVTVPDRVDHRLLASALARVTWEVDVLRVWSRPRHWVDQALGPVFDVLVRPGVDEARVREVARLLRAVPATLARGLTTVAEHGTSTFAVPAVDELAHVERQVTDAAAALAGAVPHLSAALTVELARTAHDAGVALGDFRDRVAALAATLPPAEPLGREAYEWFLREVACVPYDAERVRAIGRLEYDRAVVLERLSRQRHRDVPEPALPATAAEQCALEARALDAVRAFREREGLLSSPAHVRRYLNLPLPAHLAPLTWLGVCDDLTGPDRLHEDAVAYVPDPAGELSYFYAANARDPRLGIVHEGAHHEQLARSWAHPRPVRRHYYDSGSNEGIAFYHEELMLAAGLFADAPHSQTTLYNMMRLRALRVEVDVALALGDLDVPAAAELLQRRVPMDRATAVEEAVFFAENPGQAITYQVGKTQVLALVAEAALARGDDLDLRALHDALWDDGNVPIALQRWELLGAEDELEAIGVRA